MDINCNKIFAKSEIEEVLEKYAFMPEKPKFLYEFGEDGPTDSQLESAQEDFMDRQDEHEKLVKHVLVELFGIKRV